MNVAVIQARMGSSRLPGKVMKEIVGKPLVGLLLERLSRSKKIDKLVLATSVNASDDKLCEYVRSLGIDVFRGSENDVLDRVYQAARTYKPSTIVRVTADSPLQDPALIDRVLEFYEKGSYDYVSSGANAPALPDGMDTEIFSFHALERAWKEASLISEREHVTPYIKTSGHFKLGDFHPDRDYSDERLVVDNEEDLPVVRAIFERFYASKPQFGLEDILEFKRCSPEIFRSNENIEKNEGYKKSLAQDRPISFDPEESGNYLEEVIGPENFYPLYNDFYSRFASYLDGQSRASKLEYRGVRLLWCFKKELFESGNYAVQRYQAMGRLLKENPSGFTLAEPDPGDEPSLSEIASMGNLKDHPGIKRFITKESAVKPAKSARRFSPKNLFPARFIWGGTASCRVAVYSDFRKAAGVARRIPAGQAVFYCDNRAPKTWLKTLRIGQRYYQSAYPPAGIWSYRQKAAEYLDVFLKEQPFSDFAYLDMRGALIMNSPAARLLSSRLEKLLYDIDEIHRFFEAAKSLRSALLDEDISPAKNAFCQIARMHGVKTFTEVHGMVNVPCGFVPLVADNLLVWMEPMKQKLVRWGCEAERVHVTGCSFHEAMRRVSKADAKKKIASDMKFDAGRPIAVAAPHPLNTWTKYYFFRHIIEKTNGEMLKAVLATPDVQWILKLHPDDTQKNFYEKWIIENGLQNRVRLKQAYDSLLLARGADLLVIYLSTFAIDGAAMENHVIALRGRLGVSAEDDLAVYRLFYEAAGASDVADMTRRILSGKEARKGDFAAAERGGLHLSDPGPTERIAQHLLKKE